MNHIIRRLADFNSETAHQDGNQNYSMNSKSRILSSLTLFQIGLPTFTHFIPSNFVGHITRIKTNILILNFL